MFFLTFYNVFTKEDFIHASQALDDPLEDQRQIEGAKNTSSHTRTFKVLCYVMRMFLRAERRVVDAQLLLNPTDQVSKNYRAWNRERTGNIFRIEGMRGYEFVNDITKELLEPEKILDAIAELCDIPD